VDPMNPTHIPKEVLIPDWAHRDMQVTEGRSCTRRCLCWR